MKIRNHFTIIIWLLLTASIFTGCNNPIKINDKQLPNTSFMVTITKKPFGTFEGNEISIYSLENKNGMAVKLTNYGGIVTSLTVPGRDGVPRDVVAGFDSLQGYLYGHPYFGCIVGRYANRIAEGQFNLDGKTYQLAKNNGGNHLHGGLAGLDKKVWEAAEIQTEDEAAIRLDHTSPDGEEGYPGNLKITVIYSLTTTNELKITYAAVTDAPTPVNLTHHGYFNLDGHGEGDILNHELYLDADRYTTVNDQLIPTGELPDVTGTPMDFRVPKKINEDFAQVPGGYDHNFVLNNSGDSIVSARLTSLLSGIVMEVLTTQPGIQLYAGNFLDGSITGKNNMAYRQHSALCLETQHFPDSPNQPGFPNTILRPGETYQHTTIYRFRIIE